MIKNLVLSSEQTVERKVQEASLAVRLEDQLTKDEIYEIYLNTVFFGSTAYGVKAAAEVYFGIDLANKSPEEITLALDEGIGWPEAAMLAALISNPSVNDPTVNPQIAKYQRGIVLDRLAELGFSLKRKLKNMRNTHSQPKEISHHCHLLTTSSWQKCGESSLKIQPI